MRMIQIGSAFVLLLRELWASRLVCFVALFLALCSSPVTFGPAGAQTSASPPTVASETKKSPAASIEVAPTTAAANLKDAAAARRKSADDCAGGEDMRKLSASATSPSIVYNAKFVPAGSTVDFGIPGVVDTEGFYFALLTDDSAPPRDDSRHRVRVRKAAPNDDLVLKQLLSPGDTIVSFDVSTDVAPWWWWAKRDLYIYISAASASVRSASAIRPSTSVHFQSVGWWRSPSFLVFTGLCRARSSLLRRKS